MKLPLEHQWLTAQNFQGLIPWYFIDHKKHPEIRKAFQQETGKDMIPFARRQDNDDVAGFEVKDGKVTSTVFHIHLSWTRNNNPSSPAPFESFENIFEWLKTVVIPATQDWMNEEELEDLKASETLYSENG